MPGTAQEWIDKAESDFRIATRELVVTEEPSFDGVVFHSQQCIEKLLKAVLVKSEVRPPKIHDLAELSRRVHEAIPTWDWAERDLRWLSKGAADFRYPGDSADKEEAVESYRFVRGSGMSCFSC